MLQRQADCYRYAIVPGLAEHGIYLRGWDELTDAQREEASAAFEKDVSPALTPLVINPEHPFPFLSNLSTSLTFRLYDPERAEKMVARLKIPSGLKQWISLTSGVEPGKRLLVPLHDVIRGNVHKLYSGMDISAMPRGRPICLSEYWSRSVTVRTESKVTRRCEPVRAGNATSTVCVVHGVVESANGGSATIRLAPSARFTIAGMDALKPHPHS